MPKIKISPVWLIVLLLGAFFGISLILRIYLPYGQIFVGDYIKYQSGDSYFYMRLLDNLLAHFPHLTQFDPYYLYPGGIALAPLPFFDWIIAFFAWIAGAGHPTQHTLDVVAVLLPAILGALIVIPVFFIGKTLFNKWVGIFAAGLIAVFPGEFLSRTMLSCSDFPVVEVFFTTTALAFLIAAIKKANQNGLTLNHILKRDWKIIIKPLIYALFAGVFLGFYLATWAGALIFVAIIIIYYVVQFIVNHLNNKSSDYLCVIGFISFLVAFLIFLPFAITNDITIAMAVAVFIPPVLYGISRFISSRGLKAYYYPLALVVIVTLIVVVARFAAPAVFESLLGKFNFVFLPSGSTAITTIETTPILLPSGDIYTPTVAWGNFTTSFFIAPWWFIFGIVAAAIVGYLLYINEQSRNGVSLLVFFIIATAIMIIFTVIQVPNQYVMTADQFWFIPGIAFISLSILFYSFIKQRREQPWYIVSLWIVAILIALSMLIIFTTYDNMRYWALVPLAIFIYILFKQREGDENLRLFIIWSLVILIIALIQRRFQYYLVVNMALLSGYLAWQIIWQSGLKKLFQKPEAPTQDLHISKTRMKKKTMVAKRSMRTYYLNAFLALVTVVLFVYSPNIVMAQNQAENPAYVVSNDWQEAMLWLKDNTPEPMGDPNAYYQLYDAPPPGEEFEYPESAYAVTAWWDYGYLISRIAHRIPSANPSQNPEAIRKVAALFLSENQTATDEIRKELASKYILCNYDMAIGKFWAMVNWAGLDQEKYAPSYYIQGEENRVTRMTVFSVDYYRTFMVRLYNFNGQASPGSQATVLTWQDARDVSGIIFKLVRDVKEFNSYQEALDYIATQDASKKYEIVGTNPFISPIPLEALEDYQLVYSSVDSANIGVPEIKIFEYLGDN